MVVAVVQPGKGTRRKSPGCALAVAAGGKNKHCQGSGGPPEKQMRQVRRVLRRGRIEQIGEQEDPREWNNNQDRLYMIATRILVHLLIGRVEVMREAEAVAS